LVFLLNSRLFCLAARFFSASGNSSVSSDNISPIIRPLLKVCCFLNDHASRPTNIVFSESKKPLETLFNADRNLSEISQGCHF